MPELSPTAMKAFLEEAKAMYKAKFTPGFYHGSPSPKIKDFDPLKTPGDVDLATPGATFVTKNPNFADSFLPTNLKGEYKTGATMYPVSVNLGKHFHPLEEEGQKLLRDYAGNTPLAKQMSEGDWTVLESPAFMDHLKSKGYDSMTVFEGGTPNVAVFDPKNIRGKFAAFNPADAKSNDFMKAEGGPVEHLAGGGKAFINTAQMLKNSLVKGVYPEELSAAEKFAENVKNRLANNPEQNTPLRYVSNWLLKDKDELGNLPLKRPVHLIDEAKLQGFTSPEQNVFYGTTKTGQEFTIPREYVDPSTISHSFDNNKTADFLRDMFKDYTKP